MKYGILILFLAAFSFGDELRTLTNRGISAFKKGEFATALEHFTAAVEKFPASNEARFNKGLALGATGNVKEANAMLSSVRFDNDARNAEALFARARIFEAVGDAALMNEQQPNPGEARKSYNQARSLYAQALDLQSDRRARQRTINNIEILSQKIRHLPEEDPNEQNEQGDDNQKNDENQDKQNDKNDDNQDGENDDNQQNNDENRQNNEQNNEQNEEDQRKREQEQREQDERIEDAIRLLEHFADDARELNRPPAQKAVPPDNGRNW